MVGRPGQARHARCPVIKKLIDIAHLVVIVGLAILLLFFAPESLQDEPRTGEE